MTAPRERSSSRKEMLERIQWRFGIGTEANQHFRAEAFPPPPRKKTSVSAASKFSTFSPLAARMADAAGRKIAASDLESDRAAGRGGSSAEKVPMHRQTLSCGSLYDLASCAFQCSMRRTPQSVFENVCGRLLVVAAIALWSAGTLAVDAIHAHAMFRQWRAASFFTTEGMIIESKAEATAGDGAAREAKIR